MPRRSYDYWDDFKPSRPRAAEGIKAKSQRGSFGSPWWATRWIQALERLMDAGRLARGRSYARGGQVLNLDIGHHVSTVAHLGNIAYRTGRKVVWDAAQEQVVGDAQADKLVGVKYRKPWKLPYARRA